MKGKPVLYLSATSLALVIAGGVGLMVSGRTVSAQAPARGTTPPAGAAQGGAARGAAPAGGGAPSYRVNALWPQPLQNHWVLGAVSGVAVDKQDHVWIVHRGADSLESSEKSMILTPPTSTECCVPAPSVMEFDSAGRVVSSWATQGLGFVWPQSTGGIAVDGEGNVWIAAFGLEPAPAGGRGRGAAADAAPARGRGDAAAADAPARGRGDAPAAAGGQAPARGRGAAPAAPAAAAADAHVTKYTRTGQFILRIGTPGQPGAPDSQTGLNRPAGMAIDDAANEVYIADSGNHRVAVFDSKTGAFKRSWGGSGDRPTAAGAGPYDPSAPPSRQFRDVTCVKVAKDGMVYVCDRTSNRIQVFQKNGTFVKEMVIAKETRGAVTTIGQAPGVVLNSAGSVWDVAFSSDAGQRYLFVADGHNNRIRILRRDTLAEVGQIGDGGRQPGRFLAPAAVAVDSRGNLYTGEVHHAKRVQKFAPAVAATPPATRNN
jgi:DNA-binding beta-propeller fold protein YncE